MTAGLAVLSAVGMVVSLGMQKSTEKKSYNTYIDDAKKAADKSEAIDLYQQAVDLEPRKAGAYKGLVDMISTDSEINIDQEEDKAVKTIIDGNSYSGSVKKNIDYLEESDKDAYAKVVYALALDYYFFGGLRGKTTGAEWFDKIIGNTFLTPQQQKVAESLNIMGKNWYALRENQNKEDQQAEAFAPDTVSEESSISYYTIWQEMSEITNGDLTEILGGPQYATAIYNEYAIIIGKYAGRFKTEGISKEDMLNEIKKIEDGLDNVYSNQSAVQTMIEETREQCERDRETVEGLFKVVGGE